MHDAIDEAKQFGSVTTTGINRFTYLRVEQGSVTTTGINRFMYLKVEQGLQFILKIL
jgi:hypothetical protein